MASYSSSINLQLPESPRLSARGNEAVYAEFQVVYNALRNLMRGLENGEAATVNWGSIGGSLADQTDLVAVLNALVPEAPVDGTIYGRQDATWVPVPSGGGADWGDIGGTLSDQTDLQDALDGKLDVSATYLETVQAGTGISIDVTDPRNPVISATGGGGGGGILPLVTGDIVDDQPVFVYNPDGSLVWTYVI